MYTGRYYHKLDSKHRFSLPAGLRKSLGKSLTVTRGLDGCLFVFDQKTWEENLIHASRLEYTKRAHRDFIRLLTNEAETIEVDSHGRCLVSQHLADRAGLQRDIVIVGSLDRVEVWDQTKYHQYLEKIEKEAEANAETIQVNKSL